MNRSTHITKESKLSKGGVIGGAIGGLVNPGFIGFGSWLGDKVNPDKITYTQKTGYSSLDEAMKSGGVTDPRFDFLEERRNNRDDRGGNNKVDYSKLTKPQEEVVSPVEPPILGTDNSLFNAIFRNKKRDSHAKGLGDVMSIFGRG